MRDLLVDIIIIKYNCSKVEQNCIKSVLQHTEGNYHLTIYDNYPYNYNLGKLWNRLIENSDAEYICLLNSDTVVTKNWLKNMMRTFELVDSVGIVGPSTDNARNHQNLKVDTTFIDYGKKYPNWMLGGFCLLFPKKVFKQVGGFPTNFGFYGQEVDFIRRIEKAGLKQMWSACSFVHHIGSVSAEKAEKAGTFNEKEERAKAKELLKDIIPRYANQNF